MKIYLAGLTPFYLQQIKTRQNILESFAYIKKHNAEDLLQHNFMLDSGAFTFIGKKRMCDWNEYAENYADFIIKYNIELFFELDIYSIIGFEDTLSLRRTIEEKTQRKSIPVWHLPLGIEYYKQLCREYDYIAIGASGKYDSVWTRKFPEKLKALVDYANHRKVKVHGLGYTVMEQLKSIRFHSVDSTSWLNASKYGEFQYFKHNTIKKIQAGNVNKRTIKEKQKELQISNLQEWIKFANYAENNI